MVDRDALLTALRKQQAMVEADLRTRSDDSDNPWGQHLAAEYRRAFDTGRTGLSWSLWRDGEVALVAVAWVLAVVFVRFCEDNALIDRVWVAAGGGRSHEAADAETAFYAADPSRNARDWLRDAFAHLATFPATAGLVDRDHSPVWRAPLGADACTTILGFWRQNNADGSLTWSLHDAGWDTRFLGDLYQDLSEVAKKKYALLQTPVFVEEFILDRTLTPALAQVPLTELRLIDPACGSGHFLLGAFDRILDAWQRHAPAMDSRERVQAALHSVNGVDINPYAVAIARFRLTLAALKASDMTRLAGAPAFDYRIAVGDSLLAEGGRQGEFALDIDFRLDSSTLAAERDPDEPEVFAYAHEDLDQYPNILKRGTYHVVVGNPPYITVADKALNAEYRKRYTTCHRQYALTVPFMELFFSLAVRGDAARPAGWVGQITSNSFMKREFGKKLIEQFLSGTDPLQPVDLVEVIDTSGAYIPGHGTPTVIIVGRRRRPVADNMHAVLGVRGEPGQPADPRHGKVWSQIADHIDDEIFDGDYVTVTDLPRAVLAAHPWSLSGGGAGDLKEQIDASGRILGSVVTEIGFGGVTREDSAYVIGVRTCRRRGVDPGHQKPLVEGEFVRDFTITESVETAIWPYCEQTLEPETDPAVVQLLWPMRRILRERIAYGHSQVERGLPWFAYSMFFDKRYRTPMSITFAEVATHNHFVLDRGGKVFKQTAPVIKLPAGATEDDHLGLLGVLNSSVACFWLRQVCHDKGNGGYGGGIADQEWERFFQLAGTRLREFPLPLALPVERPRALDSLAHELAAQSPTVTLARGDVSRADLDTARAESVHLRQRMIFEQEELDWRTYRLYGLVDEDLTYLGGALGDDLDRIALGQRAFEIALARRVAAGTESTEWFNRHGSTPITELPPDWPEPYRLLVQRRLDAIESNPSIRLLERPEFKRRWAGPSWESQERDALIAFVLDRLENPDLWSDASGPRVLSVAQLADLVRHDEQLLAALRLLHGTTDVNVVAALGELLTDESVPFLAAWRYTSAGMVKRAEWEAVWELQRREDAGAKVDIAVPPKYGQGDFAKASYWKARGKLDVPKERFISYPGAERDADPSAVYGWAGWDHGQAAHALAGLLVDRADREGWDSARVLPLLAGLVELEPWLHQWYADIDPDYGTSVAGDMTALLDSRLTGAGVTREQARGRRPPAKTGRRRAPGARRATGSKVKGGADS